MFNRDKSSFASLVPRYSSLVNLDMRKRPLHVYTKMEQAINNNIFIKLLLRFILYTGLANLEAILLHYLSVFATEGRREK